MSFGRGVLAQLARLLDVSVAVGVVLACGGSSSRGEAGTGGTGADPVEALCRSLLDLECTQGVSLANCVNSLRELERVAVELGCRSELDASYTCQLDTPTFACEGEALVFHSDCVREGEALENCQRRNPDHCTVTYGEGSCGQCWCKACPCDELCVAGRSAYTQCAFACEDDACVLACLETEGGVSADYSRCTNQAITGVCGDSCP